MDRGCLDVEGIPIIIFSIGLALVTWGGENYVLGVSIDVGSEAVPLKLPRSEIKTIVYSGFELSALTPTR